MNKLQILLLVSTTIIFLSCSGKEPVAAALQNDTKLGNGDAVPFLLYQNYPNPFNPSTTINFSVAQSMHLTLKVYTEDWQEAATLVDMDISQQSFGTRPVVDHMVIYNAKDMPSGIYYYVMEGGGYKEIRAMRLLK